MHYKVKMGYGAGDFLSIDETELKKALNAQVTGKVAIFKTGSVSGNHIISITPDWNKELGFNPDYVLKGDDYNQIPRGRQDEYALLIENTLNELQGRPQVERLPGARTFTKEPTALGDLISRQ